MSNASKLNEKTSLCERLWVALKGVVVQPSPALVANEFRLRVLADWLHVSADELRFGTLAPAAKSQSSSFDASALTMQDHDMLAKYAGPSVADQKTVCDVVAALALAATVKVRNI